MSSPVLRVLLGAALLSLVACGGGSSNGAASPPPATAPVAAKSTPPPSATPSATTPEVATGGTLTKFQRSRLLGHYSTPDGASGFILDRTVTPWRAKLDGTSDVVTLEQSNTPRRGQTEYTSADKRIWIRVEDASGEVLLFQGPKQHEGVDVHRDAEANELR